MHEKKGGKQKPLRTRCKCPYGNVDFSFFVFLPRIIELVMVTVHVANNGRQGYTQVLYFTPCNSYLFILIDFFWIFLGF